MTDDMNLGFQDTAELDACLNRLDHTLRSGKDQFFHEAAKELIRTIGSERFADTGRIDWIGLCAMFLTNFWLLEEPWAHLAPETRESIGAVAFNYLDELLGGLL